MTLLERADVYSCDSIQVLSGLEPIRRRPGMYIGDVREPEGLHSLLWEVVANALDEHLAGRATRIRVSLEGQLAEVEDDGGGVDTALHPASGVSLLECALTQLHFRPTLDGHFPHVHVGNHGLGLVIVNALSEELEVEVRRGGWVWKQRYVERKPLGPIERVARTEKTGTRLRFRADRSIFGDMVFDRARVRALLLEVCAFHPGLSFELMCERLHEPRGLFALLMPCPSEPLTDTFSMRTLHDDVLVEVALAWHDESFSNVRSFVGQCETEEGGTHETGFWKGLVAALAAQPELAGRLPRRALRARDRLPGLQAVVHVDLRHPHFGGPTRSRLASREVEAIVRARVEEAYAAHLRANPRIARRLRARLS